MAEVDPVLDGYIIPMDDAHQSEYVAATDKRLEFISGFSGSAGSALVLREGGAIIQSDGRYVLQLDAQVDCNWTPMRGSAVSNLLMNHGLEKGAVIGADPTLVSYDLWMHLAEFIQNDGLRLVEVEENLVDAVWRDVGGRPDIPNSDIFILGLEFAGKAWQEKVALVRSSSFSDNALVVTALDETAWLFNLRGSDIAFNPVFFAYTIIEEQSISLYLHDFERKISSEEMQTHLNTTNSGQCEDAQTSDPLCVNVKGYSSFWEDLESIAQNSDKKVQMSPKSSYAVYLKLGFNEQERQDRSVVAVTPIPLIKASKNPTEIEGMRKAHKRDSAVLIEFLVMLEREVKNGEYWTEITAADRLETMRRAEQYNKGLSFATISAVGSNGAIIHYRATEKTEKQITSDEMYLLDSGAQYLDGTTDVTRTMHYGIPTDTEKEAYTRVLMGAIDLASTVFPWHTYGRDIDVIARRPLWSVGWNYHHGTGHGLGMFLNVHEGPGRITMGYRYMAHESPMNPGMFFSDEPGYYEAGKFGVRLETIVMVTQADPLYDDGDIYFTFLPFTLVPFESHLIIYELLSAPQRKWLNAYNKRCLEVVGVAILKNERHNYEAYEWVRRRTIPIPEDPVYSGSGSLTPHGLNLLGFMVILLIL